MSPSRLENHAASRDAIAHALGALHEESVAYWSTLSTDVFLGPIGDAWSPAENVRHLTKSVRAVTRGLRLPRFVVRLSFGGATRPSRSYDEVRTWYLGALKPGARAAAFAPEPRPAPADPDAERTHIMAYHATAIGELQTALLRWSERSLDRCRLPHPLLGPLTVREMFHVTLYHNRHHLEGVRRRLKARRATGA